MSIRETLRSAVELVRRAPAIPLYLILMYWLPPTATWLAMRLLLAAGGGDPRQALPIGFVVLVAAPGYASGLMTLFRAAVRGEPIERETFLSGAGTYYSRVLGAAALQFVVTFFLSAPVAALALHGAGSQTVDVLPAAGGVTWGLGTLRLVQSHPEMLILVLGAIAIQFVSLYWAPAVALGDLGVTGGLAASMRAAVQRWPITLALVVANALATSILDAVSRFIGPAPEPGVTWPPPGAIVAQGSLAALLASTVVAVLWGAWQAYYRAFIWCAYAPQEETAS